MEMILAELELYITRDPKNNEAMHNNIANFFVFLIEIKPNSTALLPPDNC